MARRFAAGLLLFASTCLTALPVAAADCTPAGGLSSCVDADTLWLPAAPTRFIGIPAAHLDPSLRFSAGVGLGFLTRPVVLTAPSPDPDGREIEVIGSAWTLTALWSQPVLPWLVLDAAVPVTVHQSGTGLAGITSQEGSPIGSTALRDPRVASTTSLYRSRLTSRGRFDLASRLTLSLPLGSPDRLAGGRSVVVAPTVVLELGSGVFVGGSEVGARLRQPVELAGARIGSELVTSLGAGIQPTAWLSLALEARLLPALTSQSTATSRRTGVSDVSLVPAEWLASARASLPQPGLSLQVGAGGGIPLSSERPSGRSVEQFAAVTSPAFRLVLAVRYAPRR
jgi:hypothetical protein